MSPETISIQLLIRAAPKMRISGGSTVRRGLDTYTRKLLGCIEVRSQRKSSVC
jgi:hypothetical protein